jgi:hypothetical protein
VSRSELVIRALVAEQSEYWPMHYELLAVIAEQQSALLIAFLRAYGAKGVGKPLHVPRPQHTRLGRIGEPVGELDTQISAPGPGPPNVISFSKFKEMLGDAND